MKVVLDLDPGAATALADSARRQQLSRRAMLRRCVALMAYVSSEAALGHHLAILDPDGVPLREVVIPA